MSAVHEQQISQQLADVVELDNETTSLESHNASALDDVELPSSGTIPLDHKYGNGSNDVMSGNIQTSMMGGNNLLDSRNVSDGPLCDVSQNSDSISDSISSSIAAASASLTREELWNLKSLSHTVDSLKVSNSELEQAVGGIAAKLRAIEKSFEESECLNRTLERNLDLLQGENDGMKKRLQLIVSDLSVAAAPNVEDGDTSVKSVDVIALLSNDLESTKTEVKKLGNELIGMNALTKDMNVKVVWLESEFQKFFRRHSLIVENLCPKEDKSASTMFLVFADSVLGVKIEDGEIDSVHVLNLHTGAGPVSSEKRPRPILVTFSCYGIRSRIFKAWLGYRSSQMHGAGALSGERGSGICIKEYLTDLQEAIYNEALQIRDQHQIADCWTFKGKTYIRTLEGEVKEFNKDHWPSKSDASSGGCSIM